MRKTKLSYGLHSASVYTSTALAVMTVLLSLPGCGQGFGKAQRSKTQFKMDTAVEITVYGGGDAVIEEVFSEIDRLEALLSAETAQSDLGRLEEYASLGYIKVSDDTLYLLRKSLEFSEISGGRFDCTIAPVVSLWSIKNLEGHFPDAGALEYALAMVDYRNVLFQDDDTVMLKRRGMRLTLGSIAKGYAADKAVELLKDRGVDSAVLNLGGNIALLGGRPDGMPFKIGVQDPMLQIGSHMGIIEAKDKSIVSSGAYQRYFVHEGTMYHHIFDPKTGFPINNDLLQTTIITESSTDADAYSTVTFLMGLEQGIDLLENTEGVEGIFVTKDRLVYLTSGIGSAFTLTSKGYTIAGAR